MKAPLTKEHIFDVLTHRDPPGTPREQRIGMHAVGRALVHLAEREDQRYSASSNDEKLIKWGFAGQESVKGQSMAQFYRENGFLTDMQVKWWLQPNRFGIPRICKYWRQLLDIAERRAANREERKAKLLPDQIDLFDSDEVVMDRIEKQEDQRMTRQATTQQRRREYFKDRWKSQ